MRTKGSSTDRHACSAYILLETLVALTLISVGLSVLMATFSSSLSAARRASNLTVSTMLAEEKLALLRVAPLEVIGISEGDFGEDFPAFRWRTVIRPVDGGNFYTVKVEVMWGERGGLRSTTLISLLPPPREPEA